MTSPIIGQETPEVKTPPIKNYAITRRARQLYAYIQANGPVMRRDAMRAVCGEEYLAVPWRVHFCALLYGARLYAAQQGEAIVQVGPGLDRPLKVVRLESEVA